MSEIVEVTLDSDYEYWIEQIKAYAGISGEEYLEEGNKGEVITYSIDWIYLRYNDILQQIIVVPVPYESLSSATLKGFFNYMKEIEGRKHKEHGVSEEIRKWHQQLILNNKKHLTRMIDLMEQGAYFEIIQEESEDEVAAYVETEEGDEEQITLQLNLDDSIFKKLKWLKGILEKGRKDPLLWGDVIMTCLIGTCTDLEKLKGGFDLRVPFHSLGMQGAEQFEELIAEWIVEAEREENLAEEVRVLKELKKAIQQEQWQEMRIKLRSNHKPHYVFYKNK